MTSLPRTFTSFLLLLATALLLAGCGGAEDGSGGGGGDDDAAGSTDGGDAKTIFVQTCGGCHVLSDAGTSGAVGPNLDEVKPDVERVKTMIDNGGGGMPAGLLEGEERDAVAEYVAEVAGA